MLLLILEVFNPKGNKKNQPASDLWMLGLEKKNA